MNRKTLQGLLTIALIGYAVILLLGQIKGLIQKIVSIGLILLGVDSKIFLFADLFPDLLLLILWIIIVFKIIKRPDLDFNLKQIPQTIYKQIGIWIIVFVIVNIGLSYLSIFLLAENSEVLHKDYLYTTAGLKNSIKNGLMYLKFGVVAIGLFKIYKSTVTNNG